jgi:SRSO17 transposase
MRVKSERRAESQEGTMTQPRSPKPSIKFVDEYCAIYRNIFPEVRSFENFRDLHLGMISEIKRKSLP